MPPGRFRNTFQSGVSQKVVVALNETVKIIKKIDRVVEERGGWPVR